MNVFTAANLFSATSGERAVACRLSTTQRWLSNFIVGVIGALGLFAASAGHAAAPPTGLLLPPSASEIARYTLNSTALPPGVVRQRPVGIGFQELFTPGGVAATQANVDLFDGQQAAIDLDRFENRTANNYTWYGHVRGHSKSHVILTVVDGQMAGSIDFGNVGNHAGGRFLIGSTVNGVHVLREINESAFPPDHPPGAGDPLAPSFGTKSLFTAPETAPNVRSDVPSKTADSGATIDVMVVYSNQTAGAAGSGIGAQIQQAIDTANSVYANSGITTRLRLVHSEQVSYSESGDFPTDLNWLTSNSGVASLRNTYAADLVSMFVESAQYCGYGWIGPSANYGFSVINRGCSSGNYSFPHELGHNFGARHDVYVDATTSPYVYGHGFVDCLQGWRDVMAYPTQCGGTRIPYFSNPNMTYGSPPDLLGSLSTADTVRVHNENAYTVANFRLSSSGGGSTCSYALSPGSASVGSSAGNSSLTVTAATGCAWNSTPSASWLTVAAGSGTTGSGTLNYSFDANSGPARSATISVGGQLFTVNQGTGCSYALSPTSASIAAGGGTGTTSLATGSGCTWTASSSASWLVVSSASSGSGSAAVSYSAAANTGSTRSANLSIGGITFVVTQGTSGSSAGVAIASLSPASLSFGNQPMGKTSSAQTATLTNSGDGTLTIASLAQGGLNPSDFIAAGTCAINMTLTAGQSCTLTYTFTPTNIGTRSATVSVGTSVNSVTLTLTGTGKKTARKLADLGADRT